MVFLFQSLGISHVCASIFLICPLLRSWFEVVFLESHHYRQRHKKEAGQLSITQNQQSYGCCPVKGSLIGDFGHSTQSIGRIIVRLIWTIIYSIPRGNSRQLVKFKLWDGICFMRRIKLKFVIKQLISVILWHEYLFKWMK